MSKAPGVTSYHGFKLLPSSQETKSIRADRSEPSIPCVAGFRGPQGPRKHKDHTNYGFWNSSCLGPHKKNVGSFSFLLARMFSAGRSQSHRARTADLARISSSCAAPSEPKANSHKPSSCSAMTQSHKKSSFQIAN